MVRKTSPIDYSFKIFEYLLHPAFPIGHLLFPNEGRQILVWGKFKILLSKRTAINIKIKKFHHCAQSYNGEIRGLFIILFTTTFILEADKR